jgi:hypothetical protein
LPYFYKGLILVDQSNKLQALDYFFKALEINPKNSEIQTNIDKTLKLI